MLKNTHIKTITIFIILGIIVITSLGIFNIIQLINIKNIINDDQVIISIEQKIKDLKNITIILNLVYVVISLTITAIYTKIVNKPIIKMIANAKKVVSNQNINNNNADEFVNTCHVPTISLLNSNCKMER